nr:DUF4439 domain-containing protein [Barrientosiimonas endolithica]
MGCPGAPSWPRCPPERRSRWSVAASVSSAKRRRSRVCARRTRPPTRTRCSRRSAPSSGWCAPPSPPTRPCPRGSDRCSPCTARRSRGWSTSWPVWASTCRRSPGAARARRRPPRPRHRPGPAPLRRHPPARRRHLRRPPPRAPRVHQPGPRRGRARPGRAGRARLRRARRRLVGRADQPRDAAGARRHPPRRGPGAGRLAGDGVRLGAGRGQRHAARPGGPAGGLRLRGHRSAHAHRPARARHLHARLALRRAQRLDAVLEEPARPSYRLPGQVTDQASARRLAQALLGSVARAAASQVTPTAAQGQARRDWLVRVWSLAAADGWQWGTPPEPFPGLTL